MILDRLFTNGLQFVTTSDYELDSLYPDGLHRDRMLPAITPVHGGPRSQNDYLEFASRFHA